MGGAIFNFTGDLTIINSTIADDIAEGGDADSLSGGVAGGAFGGGVFNLNGSAVLVNDTFALNSVTSGTGGSSSPPDGADYYNLAYGREWRAGQTTPGAPVSASLTLANTIMASNVASVNDLVNRVDLSSHSTGDVFDSASVVAGDSNLATSYSDAGTSTTGIIDTTDSAPLAAGLGYNGGPTQTIALTAPTPIGGAAVGTTISGDIVVPSVDQRGMPRPLSGQVDVGAYQTVVLPTATLTSAPNVLAADASNTTTTVTITYADTGGPGVDATTFSARETSRSIMARR